MRRLLLLVPVLLALLAGVLVFLEAGPFEAGDAIERADDPAWDAPPARLVGRGEEPKALPPPAAPAPGALPRITELGEELPEGVVAGRVVRPDGAPIAGAEVVLRELISGAEVRATTDEEGRFRVEGLDGFAYGLEVRSEGWADFRGAVMPGSDGLEIATVPAAPIAGVVVDARGEHPIGGITVRVRDLPKGWEDVIVFCITAADGRFRFAGLPPGVYRIEAAPRGSGLEAADDQPPYAPCEIAAVQGGTEDLRIEVEPALDVTGRVRVEGLEELACRVRIQVMPISYDGDRLFGHAFHWGVGGDGSFRIPRLAPGRYDLEFEPVDDDTVGLVVLHGVTPGSSDLDVVLPVGAVLRGRLEDPAGDPVAAQGFLHVAPQGVAPGAPGSVVADLAGDGTFEVHGLSRDVVYDLHALGFDGYLRTILRGVSPAGDPVVLVLARAGHVAGRVLGPGGKPVGGGVPVSAQATDPRPEDGDATGRWGHTVTVPDGSFVLGGLGDHPFRVAAGGGETPWVAADAANDVRIGREDLPLHVTRGVPFRGRLVDPAGNPLETPHLQVRARPFRLGATHSTTVGADGRFAFAGVAPGTVEVYLRQGEREYVLGPYEAPAEDVEVVVRD